MLAVGAGVIDRYIEPGKPFNGTTNQGPNTGQQKSQHVHIEMLVEASRGVADIDPPVDVIVIARARIGCALTLMALV